MPEFKWLVGLHGKLRVLFDMTDFHGWDVGVQWEDTRFAIKHFADIERIAMVGKTKWQRGMATFCKPFTKGKLQNFDHVKAVEARDWLDETCRHAESRCRAWLGWSALLFPQLVSRGNYSRFGIARVKFNQAGDPCGVERLGIAIEPETDYELLLDGDSGCEDPRVTFVERFQRCECLDIAAYRVCETRLDRDARSLRCLI
ncbi:MAG: STAS/SEC14 domain-containing protein [Rhodopirellula sp.]|nr:STAS/SEC14 domain-containing protein [Rhodopirellula sp.]